LCSQICVSFFVFQICVSFFVHFVWEGESNVKHEHPKVKVKEPENIIAEHVRG